MNALCLAKTASTPCETKHRIESRTLLLGSESACPRIKLEHHGQLVTPEVQDGAPPDDKFSNS